MKTIAALSVLSLAAATPHVKRDDYSAIDGSFVSPPCCSFLTSPPDATVLNFALTLEHLENAFYQEALGKFDQQAFTEAGLPESARALFEQVSAHEAAHVEFLSAALGEKATQPCNYSFPYSTPKEFAAVSQILEGVGVSAYAGAAKYIKNPDYLTAAAVVLSTEARHASWVAQAVNNVEPWSGPLDTPLTLDQVYSLASPFITSCPESNPALPVKAFPSISFTPTTAQPGDEVTLSFNGSADGQTALFLTGLSQIVANVSDSKVTIPQNLTGTVYLIINKDGQETVSDNHTVAGPAVLQFQKSLSELTNGTASTNGTESSTGTETADGAESTDGSASTDGSESTNSTSSVSILSSYTGQC
ncbi:hypothetical protein CYLTODRAFT_347564 [Cylindrobasidium torrendii FP15055 ss-10]|uniref:Ferritin-like domain-containing protein n=1 Tax=Cylindrobasidium torrendii FP15055 ss-10 TaxID=1314674 RepID=A0A0D7BJB9_9AGAR|nr:hypothetical protein CYLTODRAFT_347564 [Cylindrobasidium torrendii FP15055 ss-10]